MSAPRGLRVDRCRRSALQAGAALGVALGLPALLTACAPAPISLPGLGSMADSQRTLDALKARPLRMATGWDTAHVLHRVAQSVEHSLTGFPLLKPAWFRASVGPAAFAVFEARGRMTHGPLAKPACARAHPMHLANNWQQVSQDPPKETA